MSIVSIFIVILIFAVCVWAVRAIMAAFGIGDPISTVVQVVVVLVFVIWLIQSIGLIGGGPVLHIR